MSTENNTPRFVSAFVSNKSKAIEIRRVESGGYDETEVVDLVTVIVESKKPVSQWAVWDATDGAPVKRRDKPYTPQEFKALMSGEDVALVWCKRGNFRAPVLKVGAVNQSTSERTPRQSTRIGK
jgi:hypothetical protein